MQQEYANFYTKAVYIISFATSEIELKNFSIIAKDLHTWIGENIKLEKDN